MRPKERIERICSLLKEKWEEMPDQRLGQFLINYVFGRFYNSSSAKIFYQEDTITEKRLREGWIDGVSEV